MATVVRMPEVLANATEATIQTWLIEAGQEVTVGLPIAELETDKAVVEYAAEAAGTVLRLLVPAGSAAAVGDPIAVLGAAGEQVPDDLAPASGTAGPGSQAGSAGSAVPEEAAPAPEEAAAAPEPETAPEDRPSPVAGAPTELGSDSSDDSRNGAGAGVGGGGAGSSGAGSSGAGSGSAASGATSARQFSSPLVRRLAREQGVDISELTGSGPGGRVVRRDLATYLASAASDASTQTSTAGAPAVGTAADPVVPPSAPSAAPSSGTVDVPLTSMRRAIARRLVESKTTIPHYYLVADCRVDALLDLRRQLNAEAAVKVSVNDLVVKAVAAAYVEVPEANATWGESVVHTHAGVDVAIAVSVPGGLLTPVLRSVETTSLGAVSRTAADLAARGRDGALRQHELEGGVITVSNLGMYGVTEFSAIINPPQSAILAVGAARQEAVVIDGELAVASVMTVTMSADHRVLDGALAAQWLASFVRHVEHPLRMLV